MTPRDASCDGESPGSANRLESRGRRSRAASSRRRLRDGLRLSTMAMVCVARCRRRCRCGRRDRNRRSPRRADRGRRRAGSAAELSGRGAGQNLDHAGGLVRVDQVHLPVAIEVLGQRPAAPRHSVCSWSAAASCVPVAEQDGHRLAELAADDEVLMAVAVGVADDQKARTRGDREGRRRSGTGRARRRTEPRRCPTAS